MRDDVCTCSRRLLRLARKFTQSWGVRLSFTDRNPDSIHTLRGFEKKISENRFLCTVASSCNIQMKSAGLVFLCHAAGAVQGGKARGHGGAHAAAPHPLHDPGTLILQILVRPAGRGGPIWSGGPRGHLTRPRYDAIRLQFNHFHCSRRNTLNYTLLTSPNSGSE